MRLSPEFRFVVACCIWPPSPRRESSVCATASAVSDWEHLLKVVDRHRVWGLVSDALARTDTCVPAQVRATFKAHALQLAQSNLRFAQESLAIQGALDLAQVPCLFLKGVPLAQLAYGSLALKHSWDIDLLVLQSDVLRAADILSKLGYTAEPPLAALSHASYVRWMRHACQYEFENCEKDIRLEMHWRLATHSYFLPDISAVSPSLSISLSPSAVLRTLTVDDLFIYLCVHGAIHGWSRIKWLADAAALIASDSEMELARRLDCARQLGVGHCVAQAILLFDTLFGFPPAAALAHELRAKWRSRYLERVALRAMTTGGAAQELLESPFGKRSILASHLLLGAGPFFAVQELWSKINRPYDHLGKNMPYVFDFLFPLLRVAGWLSRGGRPRKLPPR
jgi:hypothetical protein